MTPTKERQEAEAKAKQMILESLPQEIDPNGQKVGDILFTIYTKEMNIISRLFAKQILIDSNLNTDIYNAIHKNSQEVISGIANGVNLQKSANEVESLLNRSDK